MDNMTPASAVQLVDDLREGKEVSSTRGPRLCTWREAERVLAGFPDGRVDEGPGAGAPSLAGLKLARENSWTAPSSDRSSQELGAGADDPVDEADSNPAEAAAVDESSSATEAGAEKDEAK
jgi:NADH-quinone oxidoreductase subunit E